MMPDDARSPNPLVSVGLELLSLGFLMAMAISSDGVLDQLITRVPIPVGMVWNIEESASAL